MCAIAKEEENRNGSQVSTTMFTVYSGCKGSSYQETMFILNTVYMYSQKIINI